MVPVGYMLKIVNPKPDWLKIENVLDLYCVNGFFSPDFVDYIKFWKHNGYWLFDSPKILSAVAQEGNVDVSNCRLFFYEAYEYQYNEDDRTWESFSYEKSFTTDIVLPKIKNLEGFDVLNFTAQARPECSLLSCCPIASVPVNEHCLLNTFEEAKKHIEDGKFENVEPGPFRIFAVYTLPEQ